MHMSQFRSHFYLRAERHGGFLSFHSNSRWPPQIRNHKHKTNCNAVNLTDNELKFSIAVPGIDSQHKFYALTNCIRSMFKTLPPMLTVC